MNVALEDKNEGMYGYIGWPPRGKTEYVEQVNADQREKRKDQETSNNQDRIGILEILN